jgi:hypothetical protein
VAYGCNLEGITVDSFARSDEIHRQQMAAVFLKMGTPKSCNRSMLIAYEEHNSPDLPSAKHEQLVWETQVIVTLAL